MKVRNIVVFGAALVVVGSAMGYFLDVASYPTSLPVDVTAVPDLEALPVDAELVDLVDIGDTDSEAEHNMTSWGPVEPDTNGGNWGGIAPGSCRVIWDTIDGGSTTATIDMNFGTYNGTKYIAVRWLDGASNADSFTLAVAGETKSVVDPAPRSEVWLDVGVWSVDASVTGVQTVTLTALDPEWAGFDTYGQVAFDEIATWQTGSDIPAVSEWGLILMTLVGLAIGTILFARRRRATA